MIKKMLRAVLVSAAATLPMTATAASETSDREQRFVVESLVASMDRDDDGQVTLAEQRAFTMLAHESMDADSNGLIVEGEFLAWDVGFQALSEVRGATASFLNAKRELFDLWDKNGDGVLTKSEMAYRAQFEFEQSDRDDDGRVDATDFLNGSLSIAILASAA